MTSQQGLFQTPAYVLSHSFRVTNFFKACFVGVIARLLSARKALCANPAFIDFVELWGAKGPTHNDDVLVCSHRYDHVVESRVGLGICAEDMQVLRRERTTATSV